MTTVSSTTSSSGLSSTTATSVESLEENYELFLSVLVAQLENQNPLDPTDTDEMTSQLINYAQVEQQILGNSYLENLVLATNNESASVALAMVGMEVTYNADDLTYESGDTLTWAFDVPDDTASLTAQVLNEDGDVVYSKSLDTTAGETTFTWDGTLTNGSSASDGTYSLNIYAEDSNGDEVSITAETSSIVSRVDWSDGSAQLIMENGATVSLSDIVSATSASDS
ncbi:MAG: flagellar hook capping protein [Rhodospirillaceae bacterium]|nr:flagellar hook capping protein [Rhodospirillaceae bacterium]